MVGLGRPPTLPRVPPAWAAKVDEVLDARRLPRAWLAREMMISPTELTKKMGGARRVTIADIHYIADKLGLPRHWLVAPSSSAANDVRLVDVPNAGSE